MRRIVKLIALSSAAVGSYYAGTHFERHRIIQTLQDNFHTDASIFEELLKPAKFNLTSSISTVYAATPMSVPEVALGPARISQIMKYGFPSLDHVRSYDDFVLSYDRKNRVPQWVFEHLNKHTVKHNDTIDRAKCDFKPDESIHSYFRADNSDYKSSGFDRGHMAAAGNHRLHQRHVDQTFYLSNIAPQVGKGFNRDAWNKLEKYVRKLTNTYNEVYVCTGPLYLPRKENDGKSYIKYQVLGNNTVAVPTHFFKVVVGEMADGRLDLECYCMPNERIPDETPVFAYRVPPETIERAAGLIFFDKISKDKFNMINGKKR